MKRGLFHFHLAEDGISEIGPGWLLLFGPILFVSGLIAQIGLLNR